MRILIICHEYPPMGGGGGVVVKQIAEDLAQRHQVHVLTAGMTRRTERVEEGGVLVTRLRAVGRMKRAVPTLVSSVAYPLTGRRHMRAEMDGTQYDVSHTWFAVPGGLLGMWAQDCLGLPNVLTLIGADIYDPTRRTSASSSRLVRHLVRRIAGRATYVTAISSDIKRRAQVDCGLSCSIDVVPIGMAPPPPAAEVGREKWGVADNDILVASVARLVGRKDFPTLLRALARIEDRRVKLAIAGDGPEADAIGSLARELHISDRVRLLGFIAEPEKFALLQSADLYASSSLHEGFGICFLEAMHSGLPLVITNVGGQLDFVEHGVHGYLVDPGDVDAMARGIVALAEDPERRRTMGEAGQSRSREYLIDRVSTRYERVLQQAAQTPPDGAQ